MRLSLALTMLLCALPTLGHAAPPLVVRNLRCEYARDPLGVGVPRPRLSWVLESKERGQKQSAYQVLVAGSPEMLASGKGDLWDSGKVASDRSFQVAYAGKALASRARCWWKVRSWDKRGKPSEWSAVSRWSMGLLSQGDWQAKWIGDAKYDPLLPLPLFRREVNLAKPIAHAEVYVCGLGAHEVRVNGRVATDSVMEPGWTNYRKSCPYVTYDVTKLLRQGANALGVMLGNGMYNVVGGRYVKFTGSFGPPKLILEMHVAYSDGSSQVVASDGLWKFTDGPITFTCIYGGEDFDARKEPMGWDRPGFDDSGWRQAAVVDGPGGALVARSMPPIKVMRQYRPVGGKRLSGTARVYDLGQNMAGWPVLKVRGPAGSKVRVTLSEMWDGKGPVGGWHVWYEYTLKGVGIESWRPRFSYFGFRYAQAELMPAKGGGLPEVVDLRAEFINCATDRCGAFECSNDTINRIHKLINMAILSNWQSVMTDCPHREKLGWLEQSYLMAGGIMPNYDCAAFYTKIARDMAEAQTPEGLVPDIAPEYVQFGGGFRDSPEWGSAYVIDPWLVYQTYGDRSILERHYEGMKRYVYYLMSRSRDSIVAYGLGDWFDVGPGGPGGSQLTSTGLTSTAIWYRDIAIMRQVAELLGKRHDVREWADLQRAVRKAFTRAFYHPETKTFDTGSQTANAMPLVVGLADATSGPAVLDALVRDVRKNENRVTAGDVGFTFLVRALSDAGRDDVVWDLVTQDKGPGYVYQLNHGATTLTEAWDSNPGASQNHLMLGHAEEWFYRSLAGIRQEAPGYKRFAVRPAMVGDLTWAKAHYDSVYGRIESSWKRHGGKLTICVTVPVGTTATVHVPAAGPDSVRESGKPAGVRFVGMGGGRAVYEVGSGRYAFVADMP